MDGTERKEQREQGGKAPQPRAGKREWLTAKPVNPFGSSDMEEEWN